MSAKRKFQDGSSFEKTIREYLKQAQDRLEHELTGTREAMKIIAKEKTKDFIKVMDIGLDEGEREYLCALIVTGMYQSFCYGYGVGKIEGKNGKRIML